MYVLESTDVEFKENMFKQGKLVEQLLELSKEVNYTYPSSNTTHQGYVGFLTQVSNNIINIAKTDCLIKELVEPSRALWEDFVEKFLQNENMLMDKKLGNHDPR